MKVDIKIQSISDVVTNSSTEVFIRFNQGNKQDIKNIVDALLAIGSSYRFDDLFTIEMCINRYLAWDMYDNYEEIREKFKNHDDFYQYLETLSEQELKPYENMCVEMFDYGYPLYNGYEVRLKPHITKTETLEKAVSAIYHLQDLFEYDYGEC